jgi:hypothetical protein
MKFLIPLLIAVAIFANLKPAHSAVGCDLNDPDRDVKRIYPESTGYKTIYTSIKDRGGDELLAKIEDRLGDKFTGMYETADVPYTLYEIFRGKEKIGYIHGVNQKGQYGGIQVFVSQDNAGVIRAFYIQKLTSRKAALLRSKSFGEQFKNMSLKDFYQYDVPTGKAPGKPGSIKNPSSETQSDFKAVMRAVKKNLILMDEFIFSNRYLKYFKKGGGEK